MGCLQPMFQIQFSATVGYYNKVTDRACPSESWGISVLPDIAVIPGVFASNVCSDVLLILTGGFILGQVIKRVQGLKNLC